MELEIFDAGQIFNSVTGEINKPELKQRFVKVTVPARLNAMCFDLRALANPKKKFVYNAGELAFAVNVNTYAKLTVNTEQIPGVYVSANTKRKAIVRHAALIMKKTLKIKDALYLEAKNVYDYPHAGLGSSSSLISAVCIAINEAYGKPLNSRQFKQRGYF